MAPISDSLYFPMDDAENIVWLLNEFDRHLVAAIDAGGAVLKSPLSEHSQLVVSKAVAQVVAALVVWRAG